jgi:hypothetical protein
MVLLFKPEHVQPVLSGLKTQTRRVWKKPRVKVGRIYKAKTKLFSKDYFALLRVTGLRKERLGDLSPEDAQAEGGYSIEQFKRIWKEINGSWNPEQEVWVVEFEVKHAPGNFVVKRQ